MNFENRIGAIFFNFFYTWQLLPVLNEIIILPNQIVIVKLFFTHVNIVFNDYFKLFMWM